MKKKLWYAAAAVVVVCIAGTGGVSVFGRSADLLSGISGEKKIVGETRPEAVQQAEENDEETVVIDHEMTGNYLNETQGDGCKIYEDGTFTAYSNYKERKGKMIGTVLPEGEQFVFASPGFDKGTVVGTFADGKWTIDGKTYIRTYSSVEGISLHFRSLYADGKNLLIWGKSMKNLEKEGLECTADLNQMMQPRELSDEITVSFKGASASVRAVNPYENEAPLSDCLICSFYTEDRNGIFTFETDGPSCGEDCFDDLLEKDVYSYEKDRLVYKEYLLTLSEFNFSTGDDPRGKKILEPSGECDLTLCFDGPVLKSFSYTSPEMLYYGLSSNVDPDTLAQMNEEEIQEAVELRGGILEKLTQAFSEAGTKVQIDDVTGEIAMDTNILFDVNSFTLSEEGKEYIDQFMKVYVPVLFSEEFKDSIDHVVFEGHTDSEGSFGYNMDLSMKRAQSVLDYCLESSADGLTAEQKNMLGDKAVTEGHGCTDLVYDEDGKEDKDASRRVSVKFFIKVNE